MALTAHPTSLHEPHTARPAPHPQPSDDDLAGAKLVPRRRPGRWIAGTLTVLVAGFAVQSAVRNPRFQWDVIWVYLRAPDIGHGLWLTIWLTVAVFVSGYVLGIGVAAMRLSGNPVLQAVAFGFVWFFRSVPPLVLVLLVFEIASLYPRLSFGVPFGPEFLGTGTKHLFNPVFAAYVALTLDVAAFAAEIVRGGLVSVDRGQLEAAQSIGLPVRRIFWRITLPQAMPAIVPNTGSLLIGTLKGTSLVSVIAVPDLLYSAELVYGQNYRVIPLLLVATIWYLVLVTVLSVAQFYVERHFARGSRRDAPRPLVRVLAGNVPLWTRTVRRAGGTR